MISSWRACRFKSVYEDTELRFAPLTVFSGINNSGKSTVIQSILLTAQTLTNPMPNRAVSLNGNLVRLGTFNDIVSNGHENESIRIGFTLTEINQSDLVGAAGTNRYRFMYPYGSASDIMYIDSDFTFSAKGASENERKEIVQLQPILESIRLRLGYRSEEGNAVEAGEFELRRRTSATSEIIKHYRLAAYDQDDLIDLRYEVAKLPIDPSPVYQPYLSRGEIIGASLYHFVPRALLAKFDFIEEESKQIVNVFLNRRDYSPIATRTDESFLKLPDEFKTILYQNCLEAVETQTDQQNFVRSRQLSFLKEFQEEFTPINFRHFINSLLTATRSALLQKLAEQSEQLETLVRAGRTAEFKTRYQSLPARFDLASHYIPAYFELCVKYLAPLRDEPKPVYPLAASSDPSNIGLHGEHTAAVLELNRSEAISYIPSSSFSAESVGQASVDAPLKDAVLDWLRYMGVVTNIATHDLGNRGHELKVATSVNGTLRDLTHVGVGVSQVLPIVVLCLLSPRGSILIFEQPELHLHPRVQSRLADFFLSMTFLGKQCVLETHSEHLINRLRQRVASAPSDQISSRVMMYFVEAHDGKSHYLPIPITPYGTIQYWPKGFFDEGEELATAILKAGMAKRRSESDKR